MPFAKRIVEPIAITRAPIDKKYMFDLDRISSNALVGAIHQLSSLVTHAEDIFAELTLECYNVLHRTDRLQEKICDVSAKVQQLDSKAVPVPVGDLSKFAAIDKHYVTDYEEVNCSNLFGPDSRPDCVNDLYQEAALNPIHAIRSCNAFRIDGCHGSRIFSMPLVVQSPTSTAGQELDVDSRKSVPVGSFERETKAVRAVRERPHSCGTILDICDQPTPEARVRELSKSQPATLVPIDVTGFSFLRMCEYRESLRASSREYVRDNSLARKKKRHHMMSVSSSEVYHQSSPDPMFMVNSADCLLTHSISKERWEKPPVSPPVENSKEQRGRSKKKGRHKARSKSQENQLDEEPAPLLKRATSIRQSLRSLFRSKSRSRSRDLWVGETPESPTPPLMDVNQVVSRSKSLPRYLQVDQRVYSDSTSASTERDLDVSQHGVAFNTGYGRHLGMARSQSHHASFFGATFRDSSRERPASVDRVTTRPPVGRKAIPVASPTTPSESIPSASTSDKGSPNKVAAPAGLHSWADVRLRAGNKYKDDRQSSSGNWSGSSSNRQSLESDYTRSPERRSVNSLDKDSAVSLNIHSSAASDERSTLADNSSHGTGGSGTLTCGSTGSVTIDNTVVSQQKKSLLELPNGNERQRRTSSSTIDSGESTPVVRPKSIAGLTLQNVRAHEHAYYPQRPHSTGADDDSSIYSQDQEGFFTSMHKDSGVHHSQPSRQKAWRKESRSSDYDSSSTLTDTSTLTKSKSKKNKFLSKIPGIRKLTGRGLKAKETLPPPPPREGDLLNNSTLDSTGEFPPPPTPSQLILNHSCLQDNSLNISFKSDGARKPLTDASREAEVDSLYARLKQKTSINYEAYPPLCPLGLDDNESDLSVYSETWKHIAGLDDVLQSENEEPKYNTLKAGLSKQSSVEDTTLNLSGFSDMSGYSTWPRSPSRVLSPAGSDCVQKNKPPPVPTRSKLPSSKTAKPPSASTDLPQNIFEVKSPTDYKKLLPDVTTPDDSHKRSLASSNSFKLGSSDSSRLKSQTPSANSLHLINNDNVIQLPPKYRHAVQVTSADKEEDKIGLNQANSDNAADSGHVNSSHVYARVVVNNTPGTKPSENNRDSQQFSSTGIYTTSASALTVTVTSSSSNSENSDGMSTWPRSGKKIVTVSKFKKAETIWDQDAPKLTSFRPLSTGDTPVSRVPVSQCETTRPTSLPIASSASMMPASAKLIISSPMSNQVTHMHNPYKRSMCSPVTDKELEHFVMYDSNDSWYSTGSGGSLGSGSKPPRPQLLTPVGDPKHAVLMRSRTFSEGDTPRQSQLVRSQTFCEENLQPSQPLYPTLQSMKHSISFPVPEKPKPDPSNYGRSWYDGIESSDYMYRPVSQPLEWIPDVKDRSDKTVKRKRSRVHSDSAVTNKVKKPTIPPPLPPFKIGNRSNFGVLQLASNTQSPGSQTMVPDINFAANVDNVFTASVTSQPDVHVSSHSRKKPSFTSFLKTSPSSTPTTTATWTAQDSVSTPVSSDGTTALLNSFEALSQLRRDKYQMGDAEGNSQSSFIPVNPDNEAGVATDNHCITLGVTHQLDPDRGWRLSTIVEASESEAEGRSQPTSPVARPVTHLDSSSVSEDNSDAVNSENNENKTSWETKTAASSCLSNNNKSSKSGNTIPVCASPASSSSSSSVMGSTNIMVNSLTNYIKSPLSDSIKQPILMVDKQKFTDVKESLNSCASNMSKPAEPDSGTKVRNTTESNSENTTQSLPSDTVLVSNEKVCDNITAQVPKIPIVSLQVTQQPVINSQKSSDYHVNKNRENRMLETKQLPKTASPDENTKREKRTTNNTAKPCTPSEKPLVLPKLRPFKPSEVKYSWTSSKNTVSTTCNEKSPSKFGALDTETACTQNSLPKSALVTSKSNSTSLSQLKFSVSDSTTTCASSGGRNFVREGSVESTESIGSANVTRDRSLSLSSNSLASTGSGTSSSHSERNKAARLAFLSSHTECPKAPGIDPFAKYTLGRSTGSLNRSSTSLNKLSLPQDLTELDCLNASSEKTTFSNSNETCKTQLANGHIQGERLKNCNTNNNNNTTAGLGSPRRQLLSDIRQANKNSVKKEHRAVSPKSNGVSQSSEFSSALKKSISNKNTKGLNNDVVSILDNMKTSIKTVSKKKTNDSPSKSSLNSSSEWLE